MSLTYRRQIERWSRRHSVLLLICSGMAIWIHQAWPLALAGILSFGFYIWKGWPYWKGLKPMGGYANWITALRLGGLLCINGWSLLTEDWMIASLGSLILITDGLDGFLARKYQTASLFGEYFDKEIDAYYALTLCMALYLREYAGAWILAVGLLRYVYVPIVFFLKSPAKKERRFKWGQVIAVIFMIGLLLPFGLPHEFSIPALMFASSLVVLSFSRSFYLMVIPSHPSEQIKED